MPPTKGVTRVMGLTEEGMKKGREREKKIAARKTTRRKEAESWHGRGHRGDASGRRRRGYQVAAIPEASMQEKSRRGSGRRGFESRQQAKRVGTWGSEGEASRSGICEVESGRRVLPGFYPLQRRV